MKFKISLLAALLVAAFPFAAKADDTNSYESLKVSCASGAECGDFGVNFQEDELVAQTRRTRTRRTRSRRAGNGKYYAGATIGAFFPDDGLNTGFGGSGKFGYNFSETFAAELEGIAYFGSFDTDDFVNGDDLDINYNVLGAFVNGIGKYPFNADNDRSIYGFAGGGLGLTRIEATGDDVADDASETDFAIQGKVGVGYPVGDKLDVIGQFRYLTVFAEGDSADAFSLDAGVNYNF